MQYIHYTQHCVAPVIAFVNAYGAEGDLARDAVIEHFNGQREIVHRDCVLSLVDTETGAGNDTWSNQD